MLTRSPSAQEPLQRPLLPEALEPRRLLAAGDLNTAFGDGGLVNLDISAEQTQDLRAIEELADGDLLVGSRFFESGIGIEHLIRLNPDGSIDTAFGTGGSVDLPEDQAVEASGLITSIHALPDGDFLYVRRNNAGIGGDVVRMNGDGTIDTTFATDGRIRISAFNPDVALLPSGQIVVAGGSTVRVYEADGTPRGENFEADLLDLADISTFRLGDVTTDGDGNIYVAGEMKAEPDLRASVIKLTNELALDVNYGDNGEARRQFFSADIYFVTSLAIDAEGRAVVAINEDDSVNVLARFDPDGELEVDEIFRFTAPFIFGAENELTHVRVQPDGKILAGGYLNDGLEELRAALVRMEGADLDPTFGGDPVPGEQQYTFDRPEAFLADMTITRDGDLVGVGRRVQHFPHEVESIVFKIDLGDIGTFAELDGSSLRLTGSSGADTFTWSNAEIAGEPALTFTRSNGDGSLTATFLRDDLQGLVVEGMDGDDVIDLAGLDLPATLLGGEGNDTLTHDGAAARLEGGAGNDTLRSGGFEDVLLGGDGDDSLSAGAGADTLEGGAGNDTLLGGDGDDRLAGGADVDALVGGDGADVLVVVDGDGDFTGDTFDGSAGRDVLDLSARSDALSLQLGGSGGTNAAGLEEILLGEGDDDLVLHDDAGAGELLVRAGDGDDRVDAGARTEPVRLSGGAGADTLIGGSANDVFLPGADGGEGDLISGGAGLDTLDFASTSANLVLVRGSAGEAGPTIRIDQDVEIAWAGSGDDQLTGFLRSRGGAGDDTIVGAADEDSAMFGGAGNDLLTSLSGATAGDRRGDYLDGGDGNDTLAGGAGIDTFAGGNGDDTFTDDGGENVMSFAGVVSNAGVGVSIDLANRSGTFTAGDGSKTLDDVLIVDVVGTQYADEIRGNELANYLVGGNGDDTLFGGAGKDVLLGGAGSDHLDGGDDFDLLLADGDAGDEDPVFTDTFVGGPGFDRALGDEDDEREDVEAFYTSLASLLSEL